MTPPRKHGKRIGYIRVSSIDHAMTKALMEKILLRREIDCVKGNGPLRFAVYLHVYIRLLQSAEVQGGFWSSVETRA